MGRTDERGPKRWSSRHPRSAVEPGGPYRVSGSVPLARTQRVRNGVRRAGRLGAARTAVHREALCPLPMRTLLEQAVLRRHATSAWRGTTTETADRRTARGARDHVSRRRRRDDGRSLDLLAGGVLPQPRHDRVEDDRGDGGPRRCGSAWSGWWICVRRGRSTMPRTRAPSRSSPRSDPRSSSRRTGPCGCAAASVVQSADGSTYEVRNRMTLCRCGRSANKPFCDGSHEEVGFRDG